MHMQVSPCSTISCLFFSSQGEGVLSHGKIGEVPSISAFLLSPLPPLVDMGLMEQGSRTVCFLLQDCLVQSKSTNLNKIVHSLKASDQSRKKL